MKKLFEIDGNEKRRILEMHENATKRNYLSEQETPATTPPPAQPQNTTGAEVTGTETIDKVKDAASLNKFYDYAGFGITGDKINKSFKMANDLGFNVTNDDELQSNTEARNAIDKIYEDFKTIASTYTLAELCAEVVPNKGNFGVEGKINSTSVLMKAKNKATDLGWCGAKQPSKSAQERMAKQKAFKDSKSQGF